MIFANRLENSILKSDPGFINRAFDLDKIIHSVIVNAEESTVDLVDFNAGFARGFAQNFDYGSHLIEQVKGGDSYSFLRRYKKDGNHHLLFRMFSDDGLNYHDYELAFDDTDVRIVDVYFYITGEKYTETLERLYLTSLYHKYYQKGYSGIDKEYIGSLMLLKHIKALLAQNKIKEAYQLYEEIPMYIRSEKIVQIVFIQISKHLSNELYVSAIEEFQNSFPDDPSLFLIALDGFFIQEKYDAALSAIDFLDHSVGGDPMLNLYRGNLYYSIEEYVQSSTYFTQLTKDFPGFELGYLGLLNNQVDTKAYFEAISTLEKLVDVMSYTNNEIEELVKTYDTLYSSFAYRAWRNDN